MALKLDAKIPAGALEEKWSNHKAVKVATLLSDKQMVIKEGKDYAFNPEYHY